MNKIFDTFIDRKNTGSEKWDKCDNIFGGGNLLPLWVADMDFRAPQQVLDALSLRAAHGIFGYTSYTESNYESVINWFSRRHGWSIKKEWILYSPGVVPALNLLIQAFTLPGEGVIIQHPVYHPFMKLIGINKRTLLNNPLRQNLSGEYEIDFDHFRSLAQKTEAKMFIFCSPHNPVGRVWREDELKEIINICAKNNILVISDEMNDCNSFAPVAMEAAYNFGDKWLNQLLEYVNGNYEFLKQFILKNLGKAEVIELQGTYLAWIDFRKYMLTADEMNDLFINKAKVAPNFGHQFGHEGNGFIRLNLACPRKTLEDGMNRIAAAFRDIN